jgi:hypothetical protein
VSHASMFCRFRASSDVSTIAFFESRPAASRRFGGSAETAFGFRVSSGESGDVYACLKTIRGPCHGPSEV